MHLVTILNVQKTQTNLSKRTTISVISVIKTQDSLPPPPALSLPLSLPPALSLPLREQTLCYALHHTAHQGPSQSQNTFYETMFLQPPSV